MKRQQTTEVELGGQTYVILRKAEYLKLCEGAALPGTVDAIDYARASIAEALRAARERAGITQVDLAAKLRKSQTLVARAEAGHVSVGERYVAAVLKACVRAFAPRARRRRPRQARRRPADP